MRFLLPRASMNYIFYLRRAAAKITKSAAPFIFTSATARTGNSRICLRNFRILYYVILGLDPRISVLGNSKFIFDEIPRSSRGMTQGRNSSLRNFSLRNSKTRGSGVKLGSKILERFLVLKPLR